MWVKDGGGGTERDYADADVELYGRYKGGGVGHKDNKLGNIQMGMCAAASDNLVGPLTG